MSTASDTITTAADAIVSPSDPETTACDLIGPNDGECETGATAADAVNDEARDGAASTATTQPTEHNIVVTTPICFPDCKHGDDKRFKQIWCALCARPFHDKCVNEKDPHYDSRLSYRCETCKQFPANTMIHAETMTNTMQEMITAQREMHKDMTNKFDELHIELETMKRNNEMLRVKVVELSTEQQRQQWPTQRPERTVVLGTSLLKHMDEEKLRNTKVICLPGAKLRQVANVISTLPHDIEYDNIVVLAGGNDIADTDELQDAVDDYLTVITEAKKQCANITISSVPPRLNNTNFTDKIKRFNAQLCQMVDDHPPL